jgi:uncharacterized membrane protein
MNQPGAPLSEQQSSLKTVGHVSYLLHLVVAVAAVMPGAQASVALLIVAFVIDLAKKDSALGSWQESHFRWRIRTVLWAAGLYLVTAPLWFLFLLPGWLAWTVISIWFLYRIVRGWMNLNANLPMPS